MSSEFKDKVIEALEEVIDPELGVDIVNLGLVYDVSLDKDFCKVVMTLTSMGCPMAGEIVKSVEKSVLKFEEINSVEVDIVWSPAWNKNMMSRYAKIALGVTG